MDNKEVVIPIEASLSPHDPLGKWVDHRACWYGLNLFTKYFTILNYATLTKNVGKCSTEAHWERVCCMF